MGVTTSASSAQSLYSFSTSPTSSFTSLTYLPSSCKVCSPFCTPSSWVWTALRSWDSTLAYTHTHTQTNTWTHKHTHTQTHWAPKGGTSKLELWTNSMFSPIQIRKMKIKWLPAHDNTHISQKSHTHTHTHTQIVISYFSKFKSYLGPAISDTSSLLPEKTSYQTCMHWQFRVRDYYNVAIH